MNGEHPHSSSGEDPFEAIEARLEREELSSDFDLKALLETLHFYHTETSAYDDTAHQTKEQLLGQWATRMRTGRFVRPGSDPRIAECLYDEMVLEPKPGTATAFSVDAIWVRFPRLSGEDFGLDNTDEVVPNDVLVAVKRKNGDTLLYVVNATDGVVGYSEGADLQFDKEALRRWAEGDRPDDDRPDVISVLAEHRHVEPLSVELLAEMVYEDSLYSEVKDTE